MKKSVLIKQIVLALMLIAVFALVSCTFRGCTPSQCNHEWDGGVLINATACGEGAIARFTCVRCGETKEESAEEHNCGTVGNIVDPTCTSVGYTEYTCSRCDTKFVSDFYKATGHAYDIDIAITEETCTTSGIHERTCSACGNTYRYTQNAIGHSYVLVSDDDNSSTYECEHCFQTMTIGDGETEEKFIGNNELFDVDTSFSFDIVTGENEAYIRENLKILDNYYNNSTYENDPNVIKEYALKYKGNNVWTVSVISDYEYNTTYIAKLQDGISFADYNGSELTFTITEDPNHENTYEYKDGIVFLQALENANAGYYPYYITSTDESEYLYLTLNKIDGLEKEMLICVGEITSVEQITSDTECYFGKINDFYPLADGRWMLVLAEPEITEIFDELDVSFKGKVNFEDENIDIEQVKSEIISSLFESEDFLKFLSVVNASANEYYALNGYYAEELSNVKSFMDNIKIEPVVSFEDFTLIAKINGSLALPINSGNKKIGTFDIKFTVGLTSEFEFDVTYEIIEHKVKKDEINQFDIRITQTDTFDFNFNVSIDIYESLEEYPYVQNTNTGKIHRTGCVHLSNVTDASNYKGLSAEAAAQYIKDNPHLGCNHCQPVVGFNSQLVVLNTKTKQIHAYGCTQLTNIADENKKLSKENATYWMNQGYSCCQLCHPDSREELAYEAIYMQKLYCSDWQQVATDISQWAKDSGIAGNNKKGIDLVKVDIPIYGPITVSLEVRFVLTLNIEATFEYVYSYQQVNAYGIRKQGDEMKPYSEKVSSGVIENYCAVTGEVEVRAGLLVDANINIAGLSKWVSAGVTAEVGAYARIAGVLCWSGTADEDYMAAYFEVGIYLDINAYYKVLWWDGELPIYDEKWPLLTMGYERAYFGYETYYDELVINGSYDIAEEDLLTVKYFDLKTMTTKTDELSLWSNKRYSVNITFADGSYCEILNGIIVPTTDAPEQFTDTMIITVESDTDWYSFSKGNYVYYLGYYEIEIEFNVDDNEVASEGLEFTLNNDGQSYSVTGIGTCTDTDIVIPSEYNGLPVIKIGEQAFKDCSSITSVIIPNSVTTIDGYVFQYCNSLVTVKIPSSVEYIGEYILRNCPSLLYIEVDINNKHYKSLDGNLYTKDGKVLIKYAEGKANTNFVVPDDVVHIEHAAFQDSVNLKTVTLPEGLLIIDELAFYNCISIVSINIPLCITTIGRSAFNGCSSLTNLTIPDSVTSIGYAAFYKCSSLKEIVIPNGIGSIERSTFYDCTSLTSVTISNSVTSIGNYAFSNCASLTSINFEGTVEQWNAIEFGYYWNSNVPATEVICSDGTVTLK